VARVDQIRAEERAARAAVEQASAELVALERAAALGEKVSEAGTRPRTRCSERAP
jgi:hypothetical protein